MAGRVGLDFLIPLGAAASLEEGLVATLERLLPLTGAEAGALAFRPPGESSIVVARATGSLPRSTEAWLRQMVESDDSGARRVKLPTGVSTTLLTTTLNGPRR